jgi:hypothetical protein
MSELPDPKPNKLLDQIRDVIRLKHYSSSTAKTYVHLANRDTQFQNKRHPADMGTQEKEAFLTLLARDEIVLSDDTSRNNIITWKNLIDG